MRATIISAILLWGLALAACSSLGEIRDRNLDPGAPYRPAPDPAAAR